MIIKVLLSILLIFSLNLTDANSNTKTALIIGNSDYYYPLKNSANDAFDIANVMRGNGFDVTLKINLTKREMIESIREFANSIQNSGVSFFYFSGHGIHRGGQNYLVPINANIKSDIDLEFECLDVKRVLRATGGTNANINIAVFDACRYNPVIWSLSNSLNGLGQIEPPSKTWISLPAEPGSLIEYSTDRNSIFVKYLLKYLKNSYLSIEQVFRNVRYDVSNETQGNQIPWESSSLMAEFYFNQTQYQNYNATARLSKNGDESPIQNKFPKFPWPPPKASAVAKIPNEVLLNNSTFDPILFKDINSHLSSALDKAGYFRKSYWSVPDGFAIITRLEQINEDATSKPPPDRWSKNVTLFKKFSLMNYLKALFTSNPGYYRVIVFIITKHPFTQSDITIDEAQATKWLTGGFDKLPDPIGELTYTPKYSCTALIYSFKKEGFGEQALTEMLMPCNHSGREHLINSKLWNYLGR